MVEGGSEVLGSFLAARLFDEVALFRAPILLGGRRQPPGLRRPGSEASPDALRLVRPCAPGPRAVAPPRAIRW